jgi:hypothetical protein
MTLGKENLGTIKSATLDAIREEAARRGGPPLASLADQARANFKHQQRVLDMLYGVGGEPVARDRQGNPVFSEMTTPAQASAANILLGNKMSSNKFGPFAEALQQAGHADTVGAMAGHAISQMGQSPTAAGGYRPEQLHKDYHSYSPETMATMLSMEPRPAPGVLSSAERFHHAAALGEQFDVPPARSGLVRSIGTGATIRELLKGVSEIMPGATGKALMGGALRGLSGGLSSPEMKRALAGFSVWPDLLAKIKGGLQPAAVDARDQRNARMRLPADAPRPDAVPSWLDTRTNQVIPGRR